MDIFFSVGLVQGQDTLIKKPAAVAACPSAVDKKELSDRSFFEEYP